MHIEVLYFSYECWIKQDKTPILLTHLQVQYFILSNPKTIGTKFVLNIFTENMQKMPEN